MPAWLPILPLIITVALLIRASDRSPRDERQVRLWKPLSTLLVILVAALSLSKPPGAFDAGYSILLLGGLALSLAGDVLLIEHTTRAFVAGLIAFLLAHVLYIAALVHMQATRDLGVHSTVEWIGALALILIGLGFYAYLRSGLGRMRVPVIAYMLVISTMVQRALALSAVHPGPSIQAVLIVGGALLFYTSDAILAISRFRFDDRLPHYSLWNLSTYYAGQACLALSASWFA